jgi:hypothetical protein
VKAAGLFEETFAKIIQFFWPKDSYPDSTWPKKVPDPTGPGSGSTTMKPIGQKILSRLEMPTVNSKFTMLVLKYEKH